MESDIQANQRNQAEGFPTSKALKRKADSSEQTKKTNVSSLFICVLSDRAIPFWTSPRALGVGSKDKYFTLFLYKGR